MGKSFKEKYEKVCAIKDTALCLVMDQLESNLEEVDAKELGEVADIAKDMAELMSYCAMAEYYHKVVESMNDSTEDEKIYYLNKYMPEYKWSEPKGMHYSVEEHNAHDGKSWETRRLYMETSDKNMKAQELEKYINDLGEDLIEMTYGMDNSEKAQLKNKILQLSNKIV